MCTSIIIYYLLSVLPLTHQDFLTRILPSSDRGDAVTATACPVMHSSPRREMNQEAVEPAKISGAEDHRLFGLTCGGILSPVHRPVGCRAPIACSFPPKRVSRASEVGRPSAAKGKRRERSLGCSMPGWPDRQCSLEYGVAPAPLASSSSSFNFSSSLSFLCVSFLASLVVCVYSLI